MLRHFAAGLTVALALSQNFDAQSAQRGGGTGAGAGRSANGPNAIVGRVLDPSGKPVNDVFVTAVETGPPDVAPYHMVSALLHALTNDRGEFRLDGLPFKEVYVVALPHNPVLTADRQLNRSGYGNTFYPSAWRFADAKPVSITPSGPATADITLVPAPLSVIAGTVIGSSNQPVSGGTLSVTHGDHLFGLDSRAVPIRPNGMFAVPALAPGTYFMVLHESQWPPPRGTIPKVSQVKVTVAGADVEGVRVVPLEMVRVTGRLIVDPDDRASLQPSDIAVWGFPTPVDGNPGPVQPGTMKDDWTFEFLSWPLPSRVRVRVGQVEWPVKAVRLNGAELADRIIDFVQGKPVTGLEVELAKRRQTTR
jgi:hypothetical protein